MQNSVAAEAQPKHLPGFMAEEEDAALPPPPPAMGKAGEKEGEKGGWEELGVTMAGVLGSDGVREAGGGPPSSIFLLSYLTSSLREANTH